MNALFCLITIFPILAQSFLLLQGLGLLFFTNNELFPILAQSFLRAQGLGSAESGIVLLYAGPGLSRIRRAREKESPKRKTKPFQSHSKPFFGRSIPILSEKIGIFDKFRQTFLCKTNPIYKNLILSMSFQKTLNIPNKANLNNILTWLTKEMKRTYSDFYQKEAKKTNPILTIS